MTLPENYLGADLFWWQERADLHTLITIPGNVGDLNKLPMGSLKAVVLDFALFDSNGVPVATWRRTLAEHETCFVDSADASAFPPDAARVSEGVLCVFVSPADGAEPFGCGYRRLYSLIDWYSDDGELVSLHNDQAVLIGAGNTEFTEITFRETEDDACFLVILNGPTEQRPGCLELEIRNHRGEKRTALHPDPMQPFSVNKLHLNVLFPELIEFCDGRHATLSGTFDCRDIYVRRYVMAQGRQLSGYHGGDRYGWRGVPRFVHKLLGRGEVNPMVALHDDSLTTVVNLFNTHGDLEDDFWVDARLYDRYGVLVVDRERWLSAKRNRLVRGEIADLLPDRGQPFVGHIALSFSSDDKPAYPRHLQALLEYRTESSVARVMAWSDIWNGRERLRHLAEASDSIVAPMINGIYSIAPRGLQFRCHYRMWYAPPVVSYLSVTNCGVAPDYCQTIRYRVRLENETGEDLRYEGELPPHGTDFGPINQFFPELEDVSRGLLGSLPVSMVVVESEADLAVMHLTHHQSSGVRSAEHFIDLGAYHEGRFYAGCGT